MRTIFFKKNHIYVDSSDFKEGSLDSRLMPFDSRIHDKRKIKNSRGRWVYKKNIFSFFSPRSFDNYIVKVELEVRLELVRNNYADYLTDDALARALSTRETIHLQKNITVLRK